MRGGGWQPRERVRDDEAGDLLVEERSMLSPPRKRKMCRPTRVIAVLQLRQEDGLVVDEGAVVLW